MSNFEVGSKGLMIDEVIEISKEVKEALDANKPVVGIESVNSIFHCGNYPKNIETTISIEDTVRKNGATPATVVMMNGKVKVGVSRDELEGFYDKKKIKKVAKRDVPFLIGSNQNGATTVSATIFIAGKVGIDVITTGGVGGVHVGGERSFDISSDLQELAKNSVTVVCSGSKSLVDLKLTLEYLETHGVQVIGYRTSCYPSFCVSITKIELDCRIDDEKEIALLVRNKKRIGMSGGVLIANPVPEEYSYKYDVMDDYIDKAIEDSVNNIQGSEITTYIIDAVNGLSRGGSMKSNIELLINNARVATKISMALSESK